jgi:hypothetical protein
MRSAYIILVGKPEGKSYSEDLGIGGRIILIWILEKLGWWEWIGFTWLQIGASCGLL